MDVRGHGYDCRVNNSPPQWVGEQRERDGTDGRAAVSYFAQAGSFFLAAGLAVAAGPVERSATYRSAVAFDVVGDAVCGVSGAPSADWAAAVAVGRDGGVASRRHTPRLMEAVR